MISTWSKLVCDLEGAPVRTLGRMRWKGKTTSSVSLAADSFHSRGSQHSDFDKSRFDMLYVGRVRRGGYQPPAGHKAVVTGG